MSTDKTNEVKVTVICYTYNHGAYVRQAIESFLRQKTNFNYQIIIHDDASIDNTQEIIKEYENKNKSIITAIYQKENTASRGITRYTKYVKEHVKGKYLAFCEGDDFWIDDNKLQSQYEMLEKHNNCTICTHLNKTCSEDGKILNKTYPSEEYGINEERIYSREEVVSFLYKEPFYPFQTSSYFCRKETYDKVFNIFGVSLDRCMMLNSLIEGDLYYINKPMSVYRRWSKNSNSSRYREKSKKEKNEVLLKQLKYDFIFDEKTNKKFTKYIQNKVYYLLYELSKTHVEEAKKIYKERNCSINEMIKYIGVNKTIKYYFSIRFSRISSFLRKKIRKSL